MELLAERNKLQVKLGSMILQEKFGLEKRIEGARIIDAVCKRSAIKIYDASTNRDEKLRIIKEAV